MRIASINLCMKFLLFLNLPLIVTSLSMAVGGGGKHLSADMRAKLKQVAQQVKRAIGAWTVGADYSTSYPSIATQI